MSMLAEVFFIVGAVSAVLGYCLCRAASVGIPQPHRHTFDSANGNLDAAGDPLLVTLWCSCHDKAQMFWRKP